MNNKLKTKFEKLKRIVSGLESVMVAYSGGLDSSLLLKVCVDNLGKDNVIALTATSPIFPYEELKDAKKITRELKIKHLIVSSHEMKNPMFTKNPPDRCYWCKKVFFSMLRKIGEEYKIKNIVDGTHWEDRLDFRPGEKAKKEYDIKSPLKEAKLTKEEIRILAKNLNIFVWDKPSMACLASRIPYNEKITVDKLLKIYKAEKYLRRLGFSQVRVRYHFPIARIEIKPAEFSTIFSADIRNRVIRYFKRLGFKFISVDLEGYIQGAMNRYII